jgi:hypothetical protein
MSTRPLCLVSCPLEFVRIPGVESLKSRYAISRDDHVTFI